MGATSGIGRPSSSPARFEAGQPRITTGLAVFLAGSIVLLGAGLRAVTLATLPGLHTDEAANGFDILAVLAGNRPIFFAANTGREPLFIYFQSLLAALLGLSPFSIRLAGFVFGVATIPASFLAAMELFQWRWPRERARVVAVVASFIVATNCWHLYFGGFGLRAISLPFFELLAVALFWRALRTDRLLEFAAAGIFGGLTMYTYLASRVFPLVGLFLIILALLVRTDRRQLGRVAAFTIAWCAVFAPLGDYFLSHSSEAALRAGSISIFAPEHGGTNATEALLRSLLNHLQVVVPIHWFDSEIAAQTRRSLLDPAALLFGWLGGIAALCRAFGGRRGETQKGPAASWIGQLPAAACLVWIAVMALPSIGTINTPNYMRMLGSLPPFALLAGYGAEWVLSRFARAPRLGVLVVGCGLAISGALGVSAWWYGWLATDRPTNELAIKYEAGQRLAALAAENRVFLAPLYFQDDAVRFGARARLAEIQTFDPRTPPVSVDRPAVYAFPTFDVEQPPILKARLGADLRFEEIKSATSGVPLLTVGFATPRKQSTAAALASFADAIDLIEMRVEPAVVKAGEQIHVQLTWRARGPIGDDYTIFTHLRRGASETVAQTDIRPGSGRSLTYNWRPGDVLLDDIVIVSPADASIGEYRVVAGLYRVATLQRLVATADGKRIDGDEVEVGKLAIAR